MAAIKASVNLFALLDGNDPGDKRLVDFDSQLKDQPKKSAKVKPASAATSGYKPKKEQVSKKPASVAPSTNKKPTSSGFKSEKNSPPAAAGYKAPRKNLTTPAVAASMPARAMSKQSTPAPPTPPVVATTAPSMAMAMNKQTKPSPQAPSTNLTSVLFAFPSTRDRIFKQRQEEFQRKQAKAAAENGSSVNGNDDDGKSADAAAPSAVKRNGKTHGVRVQQRGGDGAKQKPVVTVKEAPAPAPAPAAKEEPVVTPVVLQAPAPPSLSDIVQFPSLK